MNNKRYCKHIYENTILHSTPIPSFPCASKGGIYDAVNFDHIGAIFLTCIERLARTLDFFYVCKTNIINSRLCYLVMFSSESYKNMMDI